MRIFFQRSPLLLIRFFCQFRKAGGAVGADGRAFHVRNSGGLFHVAGEAPTAGGNHHVHRSAEDVPKGIKGFSHGGTAVHRDAGIFEDFAHGVHISVNGKIQRRYAQQVHREGFRAAAPSKVFAEQSGPPEELTRYGLSNELAKRFTHSVRAAPTPAT